MSKRERLGIKSNETVVTASREDTRPQPLPTQNRTSRRTLPQTPTALNVKDFEGHISMRQTIGDGRTVRQHRLTIKGGRSRVRVAGATVEYYADWEQKKSYTVDLARRTVLGMDWVIASAGADAPIPLSELRVPDAGFVRAMTDPERR